MFTLHFPFLSPLVLVQAHGYQSVSQAPDGVQPSPLEQWSPGLRVAWRIHKHPSIRAVTALLVGLLTVGIYLGMRFGTSLLPATEHSVRVDDNSTALLDLADCNHTAIFAMAISTLVLTLTFYFFVRLWWVRDPFFLRFEIYATALIGSPQAIVVTCIYAFGPSILPAWFDYRGVWVFLPSVFVNLLFPLCLTHDPFMVWLQRYTHRADFLEATHEETVMERCNMLARNSVNLFHAILDNQVLLDAFIAYSKEQWCSENILFYEGVRHFKFHNFASSAGDRLVAAQKIWDTYFVRGADREINIEDTTRADIEFAIKKGDVSSEVFTHAQTNIFKLMESDTFVRWRKTKSFKDALAEVTSSKRKSHSHSSASADGVIF